MRTKETKAHEPSRLSMVEVESTDRGGGTDVSSEPESCQGGESRAHTAWELGHACYDIQPGASPCSDWDT
jgi:hypothetical protein